jgi:hypothetical protein
MQTMAREVLKRTVKVTYRCGLAETEAALREALAECSQSQSPDYGSRNGPSLGPESLQAPHVLTVWNEDERYVDASAQPLPLPRYGRAPSFESLVRSVDRKLKSDEILQYLVRTGAVKSHEGKYCCIGRVVLLRGIPGTRDFRALRCLDAMLRNAEHNLRPENVAPPWLERMAENDRFPVSALPAFATFLEEETMAYLGRLDAYMRSVEVVRKAGEPTVHVGVGMYRFEEPTPTGTRKSAARGRKRRGGRRQ